MDHDKHIRLLDGELTGENLMDATLYSEDDVKVGKISHVHGTGAATEAVVDVGGFLGMGVHHVLLKAADLDIMRDEHGAVHATTGWTKEAIKALPEHTH